MEKLRDLEIRLESVYDTLFDDEDPTEFFGGLSKDERTSYENEAKELETKIESIYQKKRNRLEEKHLELKDNLDYQKLYDKSERSNYLIASYFVKHLSLCSNPAILKELGMFIYDCSPSYSRRDSYHKDVRERIRILKKLPPVFFQHEAFIKLLNDFHFWYLQDYFENKVIMHNKKFVNYLLDIVNNLSKLRYDEYHHVSDEMIFALKEGYDFDFIFAMGNANRYKDYFRRYTKEELFDIILRTKSDDLKKKLLIDTFNIIDTSKVDILLKFFNIEDVRLQLLDESSFYYELLIKPLLEKRNKNVITDDSYASISDIVYLNDEDFNDYDFDKMIHHFDRFTKNYIYFYFENEVKRVPVLFFIQSMKRKIELWEYLGTFPYGCEVSEEVANYFEEYFKDYIDKYFEDIAIEALEENIGKCLSKDEEDYWEYLLEEAANYPTEEKKLELENTI